MDALSFHLNVVCFKSKAVGIDESGNKLFLAEENDWNGFTSAIEAAMNYKAKTPDVFFEKYGWQRISKDTFAAIKKVNACC